LLVDVAPVERVITLAHDGHFDIAPVLRACRERLEDNQVFRGAQPQRAARQERYLLSSFYRLVLEGERSHRDIDADAALGLQ
jgi:hypothetical protein